MAAQALKRFAKIVVAIDVTEEDVAPGPDQSHKVRALLMKSAWFAEASGAEVTLLAVVPNDDEGLAAPARAMLGTIGEEWFSGRDVKIVVRHGVADVEIVRHTLDDDSDLVLLASRRPGVLERTLIGSTAMRVLRRAECAVCVVGPKLHRQAGVVLSAVALHGDLTKNVLEISAAIAKHAEGEWHVVHCLEYPKIGEMRLLHVPEPERDAYRASERKRAWDALHEMCDPIEAEGTPLKMWLAEGTPSEQVAVAVRKLGADVVVMGTIGRAGLPGALVGNTAEKLFHSAECSVIAVKPEGFVSPLRDAT